MRTQSWLLTITLCGTAFALPTPAPTSPNPLAAINDLLNGVLSNIGAEGQELATAASALLTELDQVVPTATLTSIEDVATILQSATAASPTALIKNVVGLVLNGIRPDSLNGVLKQYSAEANNENNNNPKEPPTPIYPAAGSHDAPYSVSEKKLRAAIYIPDTFTFGKKPPVVLVPGTATKGGLCYEANLAKMLPNEEYADPVWLNVPGWLLENVAWNSEFVAYAVNYIAGITSRNVSVIALSQGNLDTQWALTYWPSIRSHVSDYVAISPDYHGSIILDALCPAIGLVSCAPAVWQQKYNANFIAHFRAAGGASAWVPTTTVYTGTDDVVQPQHGANASAVLQDERNVGVLNVELQLHCPLLSPALVGTHESLLWGAPLQALIKDALTHDGPASIDRIGRNDWNVACSKIVADGLNLADVVGTEVAVPIAFAAMFLYPNRSFKEPGLPAYAS